MKVLVPDALRAYTQGQARVEANGACLDDLLHDLDEQFPGMRFRMVDEQDTIRPNIVVFVAGERTHDLRQTLQGCREVVILQALAGG